MADQQRAVSPVILIGGGLAILAAAIYALYAFVLAPNLGSDTAASTNPSIATTSEQPSDGASDGKPGDVATPGQAGATGEPGTPSEAGATNEPGAGDASEIADAGGQVLPETFEVYTARNPFDQLIRPAEENGQPGGTSGRQPIGDYGPTPPRGPVDPNQGGYTPPRAPATSPTVPATPSTSPISSPTSPSTTPSASPTAVATPGSGSSASGSGSSTSQGTGAGGQVEVGSTRVRLLSIQGDKAVVSVNGVDHNPSVGERFAERFKLLSVQKSGGKDCATMLFGDSRFSICAGQMIDK